MRWPLDGNCTVFARYVEPSFATQVVLTAQLTRLYERADWGKRFAATTAIEPRLAQRATSITVSSPSRPKKKVENSTVQQPTLADIAAAALTSVDKSTLSRVERIARLKAGIRALEEAEPLQTSDPSL